MHQSLSYANTIAHQVTHVGIGCRMTTDAQAIPLLFSQSTVPHLSMPKLISGLVDVVYQVCGGSRAAPSHREVWPPLAGEMVRLDEVHFSQD